MTTRYEERLNEKLLAYSAEDEGALVGVIGNISKNGMFINTNHKYPPKGEISLILAIYNETYRLKGEVRWSHKQRPNGNDSRPSGVGIRLTERPEEYLSFIDHIKTCSSRKDNTTH